MQNRLAIVGSAMLELLSKLPDGSKITIKAEFPDMERMDGEFSLSALNSANAEPTAEPNPPEVEVVNASQLLNPNRPPAPLPLALFRTSNAKPTAEPNPPEATEK